MPHRHHILKMEAEKKCQAHHTHTHGVTIQIRKVKKKDKRTDKQALLEIESMLDIINIGHNLRKLIVLRAAKGAGERGGRGQSRVGKGR